MEDSVKLLERNIDQIKIYIHSVSIEKKRKHIFLLNDEIYVTACDFFYSLYFCCCKNKALLSYFCSSVLAVAAQM